MAIVNQPTLLYSAFAADGDKNTISAANDGSEGFASMSLGFPPITEQPIADGGIAPRRADMNGILNLLSQFILYQQNGGLYAYSVNLDYSPLQMVSHNGAIWICTSQNGPNVPEGLQTPSETSGYWKSLVSALMIGATATAAGKAGLVPKPLAGEQNSLLAGDGTFHHTATEAEAKAGVDNIAPMTPLRVKQVMQQYGTSITDSAPVGAVLPFAGNRAIPNTYLLCDGSAVSRTTYSELFAVIGGTYGAGDGSTTFNLPPLNNTNRFVEPAATGGSWINAGVPNIWGQFVQGSWGWTGTNGAFYLGAQGGAAGHKGDTRAICHMDASRCSAVYGASPTVQPPAITMRYIIKAKTIQ